MLCAAALCAQEDPAVMKAEAQVEKIADLVDRGALPKIRLEKAHEAVLDAKDESLLRKTLYGKDLTLAQCDAMIEAAVRRLERRTKAAEGQDSLVAAGVISRSEMTTSADEVDRAKKERDWAVSRAKLVEQLAETARLEQALSTTLQNAPGEAHKIAERYDGNGIFTPRDFQRVEHAFESKFAKPMPISAIGETALHRSLGFDHRNRVDVAVTPDEPEGIWLRQYLTANRIPYFAFRAAVAHRATGAHIHIGPQSTRIANGG